MTDTYTIEMLSKMTMVEIMEKMNHYRELSISNHNDKIELIKKNDEQFDKHMDEKKELKRKYIKEIKDLNEKIVGQSKPKRKQIKATKNDLQRWLTTTERVLTEVIETNYENAEPYIINSLFDTADGRYNNNLRPQFRGIRVRGYPDKVDEVSDSLTDDDELY